VSKETYYIGVKRDLVQKQKRPTKHWPYLSLAKEAYLRGKRDLLRSKRDLLSSKGDLRIAFVDELREDLEFQECRASTIVRAQEKLLGRPLEHVGPRLHQRGDVAQHQVLRLAVVLEYAH
jgi:hypothetical protein